MAEFSCFSCQGSVTQEGTVGRRDDCPHCGADLHVCLNCRFYDQTAYNECKEPQAERVLEKDRSNFCDYFEPGRKGESGPSKDDLLSAAEALFKK